MDKNTFINNFQLLLTHLNDLTRQLCVNDLSTHYKFILEPSDRKTSNHLTKAERLYKNLEPTRKQTNHI